LRRARTRDVKEAEKVVRLAMGRYNGNGRTRTASLTGG